jgi:hypothetical protein
MLIPMRHRQLPLAVLFVSAIFMFAAEVRAQKPTGLKRFAVDFVTLKSGERLRGALLGQNAEGVVSMAVQRAWLADRRPELLEKHIRQERISAVENATNLRNRIKTWLDETTEPQLKIAFLETELDRANAILKAAADPEGLKTQFVVLQFRPSEIASSFVQAPEKRQVAVVSWSEKLADVERREVRDLLAELKKKGIENPADEAVNLTDRVPPLAEPDRSWAARRGIVDYHFGRKLDFQGMGGALFRTGDGAKQINLAQVLPQLLQSQLSGLNSIGEILGEPGFGPARPKPTQKKDELKSAIQTAEREGVSAFRVTQLEMNMPRRRAYVTQEFLTKMPDGSWQTIWKKTVSEDASKQRPDARQQIENDPQINQVLKLLEGLGGAAGGQLDVALQFGGATLEAQKAADRHFFEFRDQYLRRLDGPPLNLPTSVR